MFNQDVNLRYTWVHNSNLAGLSSAYVGKSPIDALGPEEGERVAEIRRRVLTTAVGERHEVVTHEQGTIHYFDTTIEPLLDSAGTVIGLTGASMDVTELRKTSEALREAKQKLTEEKLYLEQEIDIELGFGEIIGRSKALQAVLESVVTVARSDATVLLLGETELAKRW
jgi:PAS domain S-box-containing protein